MGISKRIALSMGALAITSGLNAEAVSGESLEDRVTVEYTVEADSGRSNDGFKVGKFYDTNQNSTVAYSSIARKLRNNTEFSSYFGEIIFQGYVNSGFEIEGEEGAEVMNLFLDGVRDPDNFMDTVTGGADTKMKALALASFTMGQAEDVVYNNSNTDPVRDWNEAAKIYSDYVLYGKKDRERLNCVAFGRWGVDIINDASAKHRLGLKAWGETGYGASGDGHFFTLVRDEDSGEILVLDYGSVLRTGTMDTGEALALYSKDKRKSVLSTSLIPDNGFLNNNTELQKKTYLAASTFGVPGEDFGSESVELLIKGNRKLESGLDFKLGEFDNSFKFNHILGPNMSFHGQARESTVSEYGNYNVDMTLLKYGLKGKNWSLNIINMSIESDVPKEHINGITGHFQSSAPLYSSSKMKLLFGHSTQLGVFKNSDDGGAYGNSSLELASIFENGVYFSKGLDFEGIKKDIAKYESPVEAVLNKENYRLSQVRSSFGFDSDKHEFNVYLTRRFADTKAEDVLFDKVEVKYGMKGDSFDLSFKYSNRDVRNKWNHIHADVVDASVGVTLDIGNDVSISGKYLNKIESYGKHDRKSSRLTFGLKKTF